MNEIVTCVPVASVRRARLYSGAGVLVTALVRITKAPTEGSKVFPMLLDFGGFVPNDFTQHPNTVHNFKLLEVGGALVLGQEESFAAAIEAGVRFKYGLSVALSLTPDRYTGAQNFTMSAEATVRPGGR
jgi:hypothetical protein